MTAADIAVLGASKLTADGAPQWQAIIPISDDAADFEPLGDLDVLQGLGVTSMPWPKDAKGYAEAVVLRGCGGRDAVCVGARDTRTANVAGNLKPGDTIVHSTGPEQAAQLQLKEAKRQAVLASKGTDGKQILVILDGKNDKVQILAFGHAIEVSASQGIVLAESGGAGLQLHEGKCVFSGQVLFSRAATLPVLVAATAGIPTTNGVFA